jgi:probable HAF family extracellular repeat protein
MFGAYRTVQLIPAGDRSSIHNPYRPENCPGRECKVGNHLRTSRLFSIIISAFCAGALLFHAGVLEAQPRYKIIRIPTPDGFNSTALGLNDSGNVVGYSYQGDDANGFLYKQADGSITDLGSLGGHATVATAINQSNQIAGYSADSNGNVLAFVYTDKITSLGTLRGGSNSEAFAINLSGQAVGDSQASGDSHRPVLFAGDDVKDLGASTKDSETLKTAYGINLDGQIVGRYDTESGAVHALRFTDNRVTDLGTLGGGNSEALGINRSGVIVGDSETGNGATHAFVFRGGFMQDLGVLPEFNKASFARAINNQGQIVGDSESETQKRAFVYTNGVLINLTRAAINMRAAGFSVLDVADGINNQGWIVGFGTTLDGRVGAFLAIPVGVTNDPPGGVNAPVADSGSVGGFLAEESIIGGGIVGGWFCPPTLWRFGWHYHFVWRTPRWRETWNREHWPNHDRDRARDRDRDRDKDRDKDKDHDRDRDKDKDKDKDRDHDKEKDKDRDKDKGHDHGDEHGEHHEGGKSGDHHEGDKSGEHHEGGKPEHHEGDKPEHHEGKPAVHHEGGKPPEHHERGKPAGHPKATPKPTPKKKK